MKEYVLNVSSRLPGHREFIDNYCKLYEQHFGGPYLFQGGKDGAAVKRFMEAKVPLVRSMEILKDAFTRTGFPWDSATTICGFVSAWPRLLAEYVKRTGTTIARAPSRYELGMQINFVKEQIAQHPHNSESIYENRSAKVDVSLKFWRDKLEELKKAYAML